MKSRERAPTLSPGPSGLQELLEALASPHVHPLSTKGVQVLRGHASVHFRTDRRVYELVEPEVGGLDADGLEDRRRRCEEVVRLNRRLAPHVYLGVVPVTREADGRLLLDGDGYPVNWVVERQRLPEGRMLDALLDREALRPGELERLAARLVRFHGRAVTGPSVNRFALAPELSARVEEDHARLRRVARRRLGVLPGATPGFLPLDFLGEAARRFLRENRDLLERRVAQWRVREGHGNLRAKNVCLQRGEVLVIDCLASDRGGRCADVASDLALLAVDLAHRGHALLAERLVRSYAEQASDPELERLLGFYAADRALALARAELRAAENGDAVKEAGRGSVDEARRYGQLAVGYALPRALVLACGPGARSPATVEYVAGRHRARLVRSEALSAARTAGDSLSAVLRLATEELREGRSVVVQADLESVASPRPFLEVAEREGVPWYVLALESRTGRSAPLDDPGGVCSLADLPRERVLRAARGTAPEDACAALQGRRISLEAR